MEIKSTFGAIGIVLAVVASGVFVSGSDPLGLEANRPLKGKVVLERIDDWSFSDVYDTIGIETHGMGETRTTHTIAFTHAGHLYVPAQATRHAAAEAWARDVAVQPEVRVQIGDEIYPARAIAVEDIETLARLTLAAGRKYGFVEDGGALPADIWIYELASAPEVSAAARP